MRGRMLNYQQHSGSGLIAGDDGNRYQFSVADWAATHPPKIGMHVDFVVEGERAKTVFPDVSVPAQTSGGISSRGVLFLICLFLGPLGIHRFLMGKVGSGIAMLILTLTLVGALITAIWAFVDLIVILAGGFKDKDGNKI